MAAAGDTRVHRRRLLFIPGFDPRKPSTYHRMWLDEAAAQGLTIGPRLSIGRRRTTGPHTLEWTVETEDAGRRAETIVTLLRWDDIVRELWIRGDIGAIRATPFWVWRFLTSGVYSAMRRDARAIYLSMLVPPVILIGAALIGLLVAGLAGLLNSWVGLAVLALTPVLVWGVWRLGDKSLGLNWLVQCFSYACRTSARMPPVQTERCRHFADLILTAEQEPVDEVLVIGFSLGANLAVRALGQALADRPDLGQGVVAVNLLTLGQSLNTYARLPGDAAFVPAMERIADAGWIGWVDATANTDPATACRVHPLDGFRPLDETRPIRRPPKFHKVLEPERFREVRRDPNLFHFQYLRAVDKPGGYDFFRLVAGVRPLVPRSRA